MIYKEVHMSKYSYKKIAIDTSIYVCKFKTIYGKQWLDAFLQMATVLRENEIHPIFVYDTKFPPEKDQEKKNRMLARIKTKEKTDNILKEWEIYKLRFMDQPQYFISSSAPIPIPIDVDVMGEDLKEFIMKQYPDHMEIMVKDIDRDINHMMDTLLTIRTEDFDLTRELFTILGIPWINAPGEAEATCAILCREGHVDAVLSEDTDVLNYRAKRFLHRFNLQNQILVEVDYDDMLSRLGFTPAMFLDFCIMCGTDYNTNLTKIGPDKSFRLLKKYENLEQIRHNNKNIDMTEFPFERIREIFSDNQSLDLTEHIAPLTYCGTPDSQKLLEFCFSNNCRFDLPFLFRAFTTNPNIIFEEETSECMI